MREKISHKFYYIDWLATCWLNDSGIPSLIYTEQTKKVDSGPKQYTFEYIDVLTNSSLDYFESPKMFIPFPEANKIRNIQPIDKSLYFTEEEIASGFVLRERILEVNNQIIINQLENIKMKTFA